MKNRAKFNRQFTAMTNKAIELGFKNIREAQANGFELELKNTFENEK